MKTDHVLVVDDDSDMCWSLEKLLRGKGLNAGCAGGGGEALSMLEDGEFDLIILDAKLPDMSGIDVAHKIREEMGLVTPILLISGFLYADDRAVQEIMQSGLINGFIAKPFLHEDFMKLLRSALGQP